MSCEVGSNSRGISCTIAGCSWLSQQLMKLGQDLMDVPGWWAMARAFESKRARNIRRLYWNWLPVPTTLKWFTTSSCTIHSVWKPYLWPRKWVDNTGSTSMPSRPYVELSMLLNVASTVLFRLFWRHKRLGFHVKSADGKHFCEQTLDFLDSWP